MRRYINSLIALCLAVTLALPAWAGGVTGLPTSNPVQNAVQQATGGGAHPNEVFSWVAPSLTAKSGHPLSNSISTDSWGWNPNDGKLTKYPPNSLVNERYGPNIGLRVDPQKTNKIAAQTANPTAPTSPTNVSKSGDAAAVLSVVEDVSALTAAGLYPNPCVSGWVYKLDNSAGSVAADLNFIGSPGNTNTHAYSAYVRGGTGDIGGGLGVLISSFGASATYVRVSVVGTPGGTNDNLRIRANAGQILYIVLNQLEEAASATSVENVTGSAGVKNKCTNFNANPCVPSGVSQSGDKAAGISIVQDVAELAAAKLDGVCTGGYVYKLDNSLGSTAALLAFSGNTGNTNTHIYSAYVHGTGGIAEGSVGTQLVAFPGTDTFSYLSYVRTPNNSSNRFGIVCAAGQVAYVTLAKSIESPVDSNPIICAGSATTVNADAVSWPAGAIRGGIPATFTQLVIWRPGFAYSDVPNTTDGQAIMVTHAGGYGNAYWGFTGGIARLKFNDGTTTSVVDLNWSANTTYFIVVRANGTDTTQQGLAASKKDIGYALSVTGGITRGANAVSSYDGAALSDGSVSFVRGVQFPAHVRGGAIYNKVLSDDEIRAEFQRMMRGGGAALHLPDLPHYADDYAMEVAA